MLRALRFLFVWTLLLAFVCWIWPERALRHPPGVRVLAEPQQRDLTPRPLGTVGGYALTAVAGYQIAARVLHTKRYWVDGNDLVPYDVALGWGAMSDQDILDKLRISQSNRFFFYTWRDQPPLPPGEIISHSANVHVIAANPEVAAAVRHLRRGQFVQMSGSLVNATRTDGFHWQTSVRRDDSGNGACELFYVETIQTSDELQMSSAQRLSAQP